MCVCIYTVIYNIFIETVLKVKLNLTQIQLKSNSTFYLSVPKSVLLDIYIK